MYTLYTYNVTMYMYMYMYIPWWFSIAEVSAWEEKKAALLAEKKKMLVTVHMNLSVYDWIP